MSTFARVGVLSGVVILRGHFRCMYFRESVCPFIKTRVLTIWADTGEVSVAVLTCCVIITRGENTLIYILTANYKPTTKTYHTDRKNVSHRRRIVSHRRRNVPHRWWRQQDKQMDGRFQSRMVKYSKVSRGKWTADHRVIISTVYFGTYEPEEIIKRALWLNATRQYQKFNQEQESHVTNRKSSD